jgi:hypothetical protein
LNRALAAARGKLLSLAGMEDRMRDEKAGDQVGLYPTVTFQYSPTTLYQVSCHTQYLFFESDGRVLPHGQEDDEAETATITAIRAITALNGLQPSVWEKLNQMQPAAAPDGAPGAGQSVLETQLAALHEAGDAVAFPSYAAALTAAVCRQTVLECQVSKMINSDTCPRPTTGRQHLHGRGDGACGGGRGRAGGRAHALDGAPGPLQRGRGLSSPTPSPTAPNLHQIHTKFAGGTLEYEESSLHSS